MWVTDIISTQSRHNQISHRVLFKAWITSSVPVFVLWIQAAEHIGYPHPIASTCIVVIH